MKGLLRVVAVGAVGSGLVVGATQLPGSRGRVRPRARTARPGGPRRRADQEQRPSARARRTSVSPACPATAAVPGRVDLLGAAAPAAALPAGIAAAGGGTLAFSALPGQGALGSPLSGGDRDRGKVVTAYVSSATSAVLDRRGCPGPGRRWRSSAP